MMAPGEARATLLAAGLPGEAVAEWAAAAAQGTGEYDADRGRFGAHWSAGDRLLHALPPKPRRTEAEAAAAAALLAAGRASRDRFLAAHAPRVYDALTTGRTRFPGVEDVAYAAAELVPGLAPTRAEVAAEAALDQRDKDGVEVHQGLLLSRVLADAQCGLHLCHAGLLPCPESAEAAARFAREGRLDLGAARLERRGRVAHLFSANPRFLNAEDDDTIAATEQAVDVATLDPGSDIAVLRGAPVEHPKYAGRPVFGAGINLTHLYRGRIPFLWYLRRELGWVHKLLRGVATPEALPDDVQGTGVEKPWVAAVEAFAIGGHCQVLLCIDYTIAAADAFMTLPARKEGIVPGLANLRLPRFTGDRIARQAIQYERRLPCHSPEGRLICDEVVPPAEMEEAIARVTAGLASAGAVGATGNRRAFRVGQEPLDLFRRYCAVYAREQAVCHFSPALIDNLERNWDAARRRM
jgi:(3,5-dihydroxyphenyl)acetyl-CoA 1,2-dioxygenase